MCQNSSLYLRTEEAAIRPSWRPGNACKHMYMGKSDVMRREGFGRSHILATAYLGLLQVVFVIIGFNMRAAIRPSTCEMRSPMLNSSQAPSISHNFPQSVWYFEHIHDHKPANLRVLTEEDGAPPLHSKIPPRQREITIVSGATAERLSAVESTAMSWTGALCLAVHVLNGSDVASLYEKLKQMHARVEARGLCRFDIQLVKEDTRQEDYQNMYPTNGVRNAAWRMATTKLIFLLDVDFKPSPGMHETLAKDEDTFQTLVKKVTEENRLLVVPAFEFTPSAREAARESRNGIPQTKEELHEGWKHGTVDCFHCAFSPAGHEPTNFRKFFDRAITTPYPVLYREGYEPYMIVGKDSERFRYDERFMYDERFRGYGKNKISHVYECVHGRDKTFQVLPNAFVFELPHPVSASRKSYNDGFAQR